MCRSALVPVTFGANEKGRMDSEKFHELNCSVVPSCEEPAWQVCHVEGGQWPREDEPHSSRQAKTLGIHLLPLRPKYNIQHKRQISYGPFKTQSLENLDHMRGAIAKECVSVTPAQVCGRYGARQGGSLCNTSKMYIRRVRRMSHKSESTQKAQITKQTTPPWW